MIKLSVFTVATPDLTPEELSETAAAAGIHGIEWRCQFTSDAAKQEKPSFWGNNLSTIAPDASEEIVDQFMQAAAKHNRQTIALAPYLSCGDVEGTEKMFRLANRLGATMVRVGIPGYDRTRNYNALFDQAIDYLRQVESLARDYNVKALLETHHYTIAPSASLAHRLICSFNPDQIGVLYDPGNMVYEGFENYRMGMELLGPYLAHVHVKNAGWSQADASAHNNESRNDVLIPKDWSAGWRPVENGIVPWKQVITDLRAVGYQGYFGVEDFSNTYDSKTMLHTFAKQMKSWMEE